MPPDPEPGRPSLRIEPPVPPSSRGAAGEAPAVMSERRVGLIGGLLTAIGPVSMALYTPAMPEIVAAFGTTEVLVKLSLTLYFGGFACAQLVAGPLSDALGRRPVTFAFMAVYAAASLAALAATSIEALIVARFVQGVGASAGIAISRAIVRDLYEGHRSARIMSLIGIILAVGPAAAPTIGGLVLVAAGWRAIFAVMAALGLVVVLVTATGLRETVVPDRRRLRPRALAGAYRTVLARPPLPRRRRDRCRHGRGALRAGDLPALHPDGAGRPVTGGLRARHAPPVGELSRRLARLPLAVGADQRLPARRAGARLHRRRERSGSRSSSSANRAFSA